MLKFVLKRPFNYGFTVLYKYVLLSRGKLFSVFAALFQSDLGF